VDFVGLLQAGTPRFWPSVIGQGQPSKAKVKVCLLQGQDHRNLALKQRTNII